MQLYFTLLLLFFSNLLFGQLEQKYDLSSKNLPYWVTLMYDEKSDVGNVIQEYEKFYRENEFKKNKYTQYYKRWLRDLSRTSNPNLENIINNENSNHWTCVGPFDFDQHAESRSYAPGAAHVYTVEQSVQRPNVIYAGTATAGAWRSNDLGSNWTLITKNLPVSSVYAIEIDFSNDSIIYISGNNKLYKSIDSGQNWIIVGDSLFNSLNHSIKDIKLNPDDNQHLFVASNHGLFVSNNGGNNFNNIINGIVQEIEFCPSSSDTIYAINQTGDSTEFYRSNDNGLSFNKIGNGWPSPILGDEQKRTEIAVTISNPNKIVALATGKANGGSGLYGIYVSYDKGDNWQFRCCGPQPGGMPSPSNLNLMGWQDDGSDDGGQYYYDLALAINPFNENIIHVGGVNHWISTDDGFTFNCPAKWSHPDKKEYVHADIHDINYYGSNLWIACDGGIFYSNNAGDSIVKKMNGIAGTDFWGFGSGFKDNNVMIGGTYHNGTLLKDNSTYINGWLSTDGGDNVRGFVNFGNPRIAYSDYGGKILSGNRTIAIDNFSINKLPNSSYIVGESSQIEFDPRCYNIFYSGNDTTLWKTKNNGLSFEPVHHFNDKITSIEISWKNPDVIYVATWESWWGDKRVWRTSDGGKNWTDITPSSNTQNGSVWRPFDIAVSDNDENVVWLARCTQSGNYSYANGFKVFKSNDGGINWINLSTSTLDNDKPTNIQFQRGSNGGIYLGTRNKVYYRNNFMSDWQVYDNGLPFMTHSTQLEINYYEGKLINATNRSVYDIDLYENTPPSAQISADKLEISCKNDTVFFVDHSAVRKASATWSWSFPGGNPSSSNLENPIVVYNVPGSYDVSLTVSDNYGSSTQTINNMINYTDSVSKIGNNQNYVQDFESSSFPPIGWEIPNSSFGWQKLFVDTGASCIPSQVVYVNNYYTNQRGSEAYLITNKVKLGNGVNAQQFLSYDYAYSGYSSSYNDGFRIDISLDCGLNWDSIFGAKGSDLQTTGYYGSSWLPTCGSWKKDSINLSNLGLNGDTIIIRFVAINDYGNNFYLDNVNISGKNILDSKNYNLDDEITIFPNPSTGTFRVMTNIENYSFKIFDSFGKRILSKQNLSRSTKVDLTAHKKGIYQIIFESNDKLRNFKLVNL